MTSIDLRTIEISAPRDTSPDVSARQSDSKSRFSDVLNATLERPEEADADDVTQRAERISTDTNKATDQPKRPTVKSNTKSNSDDQVQEYSDKNLSDDSDRAAAAQTDHPVASPPSEPAITPDAAAPRTPDGIAITPVGVPTGVPSPEAGATVPAPQTLSSDTTLTQDNGGRSVVFPPPVGDPLFGTKNTAANTSPLAEQKNNLPADAQPMADIAVTAAGNKTPSSVDRPSASQINSIVSSPVSAQTITQTPNAADSTLTNVPQPPAQPSRPTPSASSSDPDDSALALLQLSLGEKPISTAASKSDDPAVRRSLSETEADPDTPSQQILAAKPDVSGRTFSAVSPATGLVAQETAQSNVSSSAIAQGSIAETQIANDKLVSKTAETETSETKPSQSQSEQSHDTVGMADPSLRTPSVSTDLAATQARASRAAFHPIVAQVVAHVSQAALDGQDRISIRLSPAELGRIDVKLDFGPDGRIQAVFAADRAQTVDLLQRDARDLERALQDAGLRADSGSLTFNLRSDQRDGNAAFATLSNESNSDEPPVDLHASHVQAYNAPPSSGRVDIRV